jgi:hypothetical protein
MEEEEKKSKPKVGMNVAMIDWDQPILDFFVTTRGQKARMLKEEIQEKELSLREEGKLNGEKEKMFFKM